MYEMRRPMLACTDETKISAFLSAAMTGYLGLADRLEPYVVPLNFVWWNGAVYVHGAEAGRKMEVLKRNARVCFTVSEHFGTMVHPVPAKTDTGYMSVMLFGTAEIVTDLDEATEAMQQLLHKYVPGYFSTPLSKHHVETYRSSMGSRTVVLKIIPHTITAKEKPLDEERVFYDGRKVADDIGTQKGQP
ncbi:pyridoxamine 5'-phosphate oxidase-like FMN-binding protein [Anoxybacillus flavithermus NBRC 109594]|uniref:Pyridoxamine 5'-phosphate oxidase-like FMN-binding protein n=1 Tax=Anoxybacillus flavithermus NBRC 109594 TaxID=1315967 RepID=R4FF98_9BACL|nr:pyridoxamine 5'-phosphate oxidase-like FMN-binding protein [Anoxybacillus flavithermus NBRC 109594]